GRRTLSNSCNGRCVPHGQLIPSENRCMFQIVRLALDDSGEVTTRRALQPCFELWEDAMAMAEFDASRLWGDYGRDEEQDCWYAAMQVVFSPAGRVRLDPSTEAFRPADGEPAICGNRRPSARATPLARPRIGYSCSPR